MLLFIVCITIGIILITSRVIYRYLENKSIIPIQHHPYTNKKMLEYFWEFTRIYVFVIATIVFLVSGYLKVFIGLLIVTVLQCIVSYLTYKEDRVKGEKSREIVFEIKDFKEYEEYISSLEKNQANSVILPQKILLHNDYIYFSKNKKILIKEKMYKYMFISSILRKERVVIFKYGFLGVPLFKKILFIPSAKKKGVEAFLYDIEEKRKKVAFTEKYFSVFKNTKK